MKLQVYLNQRDQQLSSSTSFAATEISGSIGTYGLSTAAATQITSTSGAFTTALNALEVAENAYRAAVMEKDRTRADLVATFGKWMRFSYANPAVADSAFGAIGLDARDVPSPRPVTAPLDLSAIPNQDGTVKLKWKRNGNTSSTTFSIEAKVEDGAWELVAVTNRSKIELSNYEPGVQVAFRVQAIKGEQVSDYSNIVTIYYEGGASLRVAA